MSERELKIARVCVDLLPKKVKGWFVSEDWVYIACREDDLLSNTHPLRMALKALEKAFRSFRSTFPSKDSLPGDSMVFLCVQPDGWSWNLCSPDDPDGESREVFSQAGGLVRTNVPRLGRLFLDGNKNLAPYIEKLRVALQEHVSGPKKPAEVKQAPEPLDLPKEAPETPEPPQVKPEETSRGGYTKAQEQAALEAAFGKDEDEAPAPEPKVPSEEPEPGGIMLDGAEAAKVLQKNADLASLTPIADPPGPSAPPKITRRRAGRPPGSKNRAKSKRK